MDGDPAGGTSPEARLRARRAVLVAAAETGDEAARPVALDQARTGRLTRMDALQGQAMAKASGARRTAEIRRIDAALARLAAGEYGDCLACGEPIPAPRLEADPAATRCLACAEAAEAR